MANGILVNHLLNLNSSGGLSIIWSGTYNRSSGNNGIIEFPSSYMHSWVCMYDYMGTNNGTVVDQIILWSNSMKTDRSISLLYPTGVRDHSLKCSASRVYVTASNNSGIESTEY